MSRWRKIQVMTFCHHISLPVICQGTNQPAIYTAGVCSIDAVVTGILRSSTSWLIYCHLEEYSGSVRGYSRLTCSFGLQVKKEN